MEQGQRIELIRQIIETWAEVDVMSVMNVLNVDTITLTSDFRFLISEGELLQVRPGVYKKRFDVRKYLEQALALREKKFYNPEFLENYIPNESSLWSQDEREKLQELQWGRSFWFEYRTYLTQIENFLYDTIECISCMNHSSYTRLDIEIYLRHSVRPSWIPFSQSQDIHNLMKAFEYMRESYQESSLTLHDFEDISRIICDKRVADTELGKLRSFMLELEDTAYIPLSDDNELEKQYELCIEICWKIEDPFEKMLFLLVFISYMLPFSDGNKELTYFLANIPLLQAWYIPFTLYGIDTHELDIAYKALYELCDIVFLKNIITESYTKNISRYSI